MTLSLTSTRLRGHGAGLRLLSAGLLMLCAGSAFAADLRIGTKEPPLSPDPHWSAAGTIQKVSQQVFDPIVRKDIDGKVVPNLAESWQMTDDLTWVFKLRRDVKFSNGNHFTADDVVYSYKRAGIGVPNSPLSYVSYIKQLKSYEAVDPYTLKVVTTEPNPGILDIFATILVVSKKVGEASTPDDFANGKASIGTGPYMFESWAPNDNMVIRKNPAYWGEKEPWDKITYRAMPVDASRIAALLAGDVDVIDNIPPDEVDRLKTIANVSVVERAGPKITHVGLDSREEALTKTGAGAITGPNGEKLDKNPLADKRVRLALKLALDLDALVKRIQKEHVVPTGQFFLPGVSGNNPDVKPWKQDIAKAQALLTESGWAGKFKLDLNISAAAFPKAQETAEAVAQQWVRIGVPTTVSNSPYQPFVARRAQRETPVFLAIFLNGTATPEFLYPNFMHSTDPKRGLGVFNYSSYSNPEIDKLIEEAGVLMDAKKRSSIYDRIAKLAEDDNSVIPLWLSIDAAASKKGIVIKPRADGQVYPTMIRAAN